MFPFAEAAAAAIAVEGLIEAIDQAVEAHVAAGITARVGFEGATRQRFDTALEAALDDLGRLRRQLTADLGALEDDVATARRRAARSVEDLRQGQVAQSRWRAAQVATS